MGILILSVSYPDDGYPEKGHALFTLVSAALPSTFTNPFRGGGPLPQLHLLLAEQKLGSFHSVKVVGPSMGEEEGGGGR